MNEVLYDLCDWPMIEAIVYSEHDNPHSILGAHEVEEGLLVNAFVPDAANVFVVNGNEKFEMEKVDDAGFFALLLEGRKAFRYKLRAEFEDGTFWEKYDPYSFEPSIDGQDIERFSNGIGYDIYKKMGAHETVIDGVRGISFAVWAPNAMRVSLVGDFNFWDGRIHQMRRVAGSGIYEIFVPELTGNVKYKYEIKLRGDLCVMKADPYGYESEKMPDNASITWDLEKFGWTDSEWVDKRNASDITKQPVSVLQINLDGFMGKVVNEETGETAYANYRDCAVKLCDYAKKMNYTHVELMPIMEHPFDDSMGFATSGYYCPTSRFGTPDDFMYFVNYLHVNGIGVILDWVPCYFARDTFALGGFDGTCLYEHQDPKKGVHPIKKTLMFNYARGEVTSFLIANAMFWVEKYHVDGLRINDVAYMLYLDYNRNFGEWIPNIYGGNENIEGVEFLKHLNSIMNKKHPYIAMIAEENTSWPKVTGDVEKEDGLGFTFKWNNGYVTDLLKYLKCDPLFRKGRHDQILNSMYYNYSERFMIAFSYEALERNQTSIIAGMLGEYYNQFANARTALAYSFMHPGKKLIFMGQDFADYEGWKPGTPLDFGLLNYDTNKQYSNMVSALNEVYKTHPALYSKDFDTNGFEWINDNDTSRSILSFIRNGEKEEDMLVIVVNFTPVTYDDYPVAVPFRGRYKEIFNSESTEFGGSGTVNKRVKNSKKESYCGRDYMINVTVGPMSVCVFEYTPIANIAKKKDDSKSKKVEVKPEEVKSEGVTQEVKNEDAKAEPAKEKPAKKPRAPRKSSTKK